MPDAIALAPDPDLQPDAAPTDQAEPVDAKEIVKNFKSRIETAKRNKKNFSEEWKGNVERRLGHPIGLSNASAALDDGDLQSTINPDWSLTKTKTANLYSQVPAVQATHENSQFAPAIPPFAKSLNYELGEKRSHVGVAMEEVLNDVVNAAGVGAVLVGYAARFETVDLPIEEVIQSPQGPIPVKGLSPENLKQAAWMGLVHLKPTPRVVSDKFYVTRISPTDLLWPADFTGSWFDDADWVGRTGRMSWSEATHELKLTEAQKDDALGSSSVRPETDLRSQPETNSAGALDQVTFDEIYYWRHRVDPSELSFSAIWKLVVVHGIDDPVIHEPWKGQQYLKESRKYIGACLFPIRLLTLTYITDNPIPPSDTSAGRPQVDDLRRSRSQMFQNREFSKPIRGFDVNRVDPLIQTLLMKGQMQGWIPLNGNGQNAIWEVARASYPSEDFSFDQAAKADLMETWQVGPNQMGTVPTGEKATKAEVQTTQANFATRIGQERAKVASFFLSIAEVLAGLMALYSDFPILTPQERQAMEQAWDRKTILHDLVLKIRPDATIMIDSQARVQRLSNVLNLLGKSGMINPLPIITEMVELSGLDPSQIVKPPTPPQPEPPSISYRFGGKDDLTNPMVVAMLIEEKKAPSDQSVQAAIKLLAAAQTAMLAPPPNPSGPGQLAPSSHEPHPGGIAPHQNPGALPSGPHAMTDQHPEWNLLSKVAKRSRDMGSGS